MCLLVFVCIQMRSLSLFCSYPYNINVITSGFIQFFNVRKFTFKPAYISTLYLCYITIVVFLRIHTREMLQPIFLLFDVHVL